MSPGRSAAGTNGIGVYVDPPSHHFLQDRLFEVDNALHTGDSLNLVYVHLREVLNARGIEVRTADYLPESPAPGCRIYLSFGRRADLDRLARRPDVVLSAFFAMECPLVDPVMYRDLPRLGRHFRRMYSISAPASLARYTGQPVELEGMPWPQAFSGVHEPAWRATDRRFLVMINANKVPRSGDVNLYVERLRAVAHFERHGEIDLYGKGWDGPPFRVGPTALPGTAQRLERYAHGQWLRLRPDPLLGAARRAWRGTVDAKIATLGRYDFAICFENMELEGWITEKIFDCWYAGCVPVYWGAPDVQDRLPEDTFVDMRRFGDYGELRRFLKSLGPDEVRGYRERARAFLESPAFRPFSKEALAERIAGMVEEDAGDALH